MKITHLFLLTLLANISPLSAMDRYWENRKSDPVYEEYKEEKEEEGVLKKESPLTWAIEQEIKDSSADLSWADLKPITNPEGKGCFRLHLMEISEADKLTGKRYNLYSTTTHETPASFFREYCLKAPKGGYTIPHLADIGFSIPSLSLFMLEEHVKANTTRKDSDQYPFLKDPFYCSDFKHKALNLLDEESVLIKHDKDTFSIPQFLPYPAEGYVSLINSMYYILRDKKDWIDKNLAEILSHPYACNALHGAKLYYEKQAATLLFLQKRTRRYPFPKDITCALIIPFLRPDKETVKALHMQRAAIVLRAIKKGTHILEDSAPTLEELAAVKEYSPQFDARWERLELDRKLALDWNMKPASTTT